MKDYIIIACAVIICVVVSIFLAKRSASDISGSLPIDMIPEKISTDTIYSEIKILEIKSDTIEIYYEKKVKNYRTLATPERVRLFAERINR
jgi:hypothetical protein|tara:strand:- start:462 stop:734 length:273 start_codon:yes stop_codon:yes gene_type:complete